MMSPLSMRAGEIFRLTAFILMVTLHIRLLAPKIQLEFNSTLMSAPRQAYKCTMASGDSVYFHTLFFR